MMGSNDVKEKDLNTVMDLIYLDEKRASSLYSQMKGGLLTEITHEGEQTKIGTRSGGLDLKLVHGDIESNTENRHLSSVRTELHHYLVTDMLMELSQRKAITHIDFSERDRNLLDESNRSYLLEFPFVLVKGKPAIEPICKLGTLCDLMKKAANAVNLIKRDSIENSKEYKKLDEDFEKLYESEKDRNKKSELKRRFAGLKKQIIEDNQVQFISDKFKDAVKDISDSLIKDYISLRMYGDDLDDAIQVVTNLRRSYLINDDLEYITLDYGYYPSVNWTLLGIVSKAPMLIQGDHEKQNNTDSPKENSHTRTDLEKSYSGIYSAYEGMLDEFRSTKFPRITITPIAIYRDVFIGYGSYD